MGGKSPAIARISALLGEVENTGHELAPEQIADTLAMLVRLQALFSVRLNSRTGVEARAEPDRLLTVEEAADRLALSPDTVYRRARSFPFTVRIGRSVRFSAAGIDKFIRLRQGQP